MTVNGIEAIGGFTPLIPTTVPTAHANPVSATGDSGFGSMLADGIDHLESVTDKTDQLAVKAATGDLNAIHDYTIAATEASVTTQLTVAVRNKAVEAFNEIMRMQV